MIYQVAEIYEMTYYLWKDRLRLSEKDAFTKNCPHDKTAFQFLMKTVRQG